MLPLPSARTYETRLPSEARILELWDSVVPIISGTGADTVCSSLPPTWVRGTGISSGVLHKHLLFHIWATWVRAWVKVEDRALRPRHVYAMIPRTEPADQSTLQGMFLFSRRWARVLFDCVAYACDCVC